MKQEMMQNDFNDWMDKYSINEGICASLEDALKQMQNYRFLLEMELTKSDITKADRIISIQQLICGVNKSIIRAQTALIEYDNKDKTK